MRWIAILFLVVLGSVGCARTRSSVVVSGEHEGVRVAYRLEVEQ